MALDVNDVADDVRFFKRKFGNIENHAHHENPSISFSKEALREQITNYMGSADSDYVKYLTGDYMSICHDPQPESGDYMSICYYPQPESQHEFSVDVGDDPEYALFLSSLKKDGSSYVLEANEKTGLIKPLRYEEYEADDEGQGDLDSPSKTKWRESQIDNDYALFCDNMRVEGSNVIYQCENCLHAVYDCLDLPNFQTDTGTSTWKQKSKRPIHIETSNDILEEKSSSPSGSPRRKIRSKFRVRILRILSKPYDIEEHKKLMQAITEQKPQSKHIDLRSTGVKFYPSDKMGKSLLDHHGDLKRKVQAAAKDDFKQLNLLRGFFFWLQNLTQEGSFMPWNDNECLTMQPEAC